MSTDTNDRRSFLKTVGLSAAALSAARASSAAETPQRTASASGRKRSRLDGLPVDVLVVGGGPAGIGAALGAAKLGAKTLLIENHAFFGGLGRQEHG